MAIPQTHKTSNRMRITETNNELRDFSLAIIIASPVNSLRANSSREQDRRCRKDGRSRISAQLLTLATLGYIFHSITEWLGAFGLVKSSIQHIVPGDVGIKMMSFGLIFEQSFQFRQFLRVLFG